MAATRARAQSPYAPSRFKPRALGQQRHVYRPAGKPRRLRAQGSYKDYQVPYVSRHSFVHSRFRCAAAETR